MSYDDHRAWNAFWDRSPNIWPANSRPEPGEVRVTLQVWDRADRRVVTLRGAMSIDAYLAGNHAHMSELMDAAAKWDSRKGAPAWQAGDVVLFSFQPDTKRYTYVVESVEPWCTSGSRSLSESELSRGWTNHRAFLAMRDGAVNTDQALYCVNGSECDEHQ